MEDISNIFKEIAKEIIVEKENVAIRKNISFTSPSYKSAKCDDQYIGVIKVGIVFPRFTKWKQCSLENPKNKEMRVSLHDKLVKNQRIKTIAIVIESPHIHEFSLSPPMPAMDATGKHLFIYLPQYITESYLFYKERELINKELEKHIIAPGKYKIYLVNAIQYQCSLSKSTKEYRDEVFTKMWSRNEVKDDFKNRLKQINKLEVIINACTKGEKKPELRSLVQEVIDEEFPNVKKMHSSHPCDWKEVTKIKPCGWKN